MSTREGRWTRFAPALAVLVVFAAGSGVVLADGGESSLIHGCVTRDTTTPNMIVTGANQRCPPNTTPIHWPADQNAQVELPSGGVGLDSASLLKAAPPSNKAIKTLFKPRGIRPNNTKTVVENFSKVVPDGLLQVSAQAMCPGSHPYLLTGGKKLLHLKGNLLPSLNWADFSYPIGDYGWYGSYGEIFSGPGEMAGEVSATCAAVKKK
jgi:hypothetical protein